MRPLVAGGLGIMIGAGAMIALFMAHASRVDDLSTLAFPDKAFYLSDDRSILAFSGSVTGGDLAYPNNIFSVNCTKEKAVCETASISQIGSNQIGSLDLYEYDIIEWSADYVVARSDDPATTALCSVVTFHANLHTEEVTYVVEPVSRNLANGRLCPSKFNDSATRRYQISPSPFLRKLNSGLNKANH